ncbi:hypothetical protein ANCCAN_07996, partial [Ancylostoma caninum]
LQDKSDPGTAKRLDDHRNGAANTSVPPRKPAAESTSTPSDLRVDREKMTVDTKRETSGTASASKGNGSSCQRSSAHDRKSDRRIDGGCSRERYREESRQSSNSKASENERSDKNHKERRTTDGQNQRSYRETREDFHHRPRNHHDRPAHHRHHDSLRHSGGSVSNAIPKAEESEQEDKVVPRKLDAVTNKEKGTPKQAENVWMGKRRTKRSKRTDRREGPMDAFVTRRGGARDPVARLSLLGAGLEPVADEDPYSLVTENSRRFDRPLVRRREERLPTFQNETIEEEKPVADSCDLLGSIIPEQMKTLAPGRLFAVRGGRFNTTDDFEKYKERKTNQLSSELKERLGIPVDKSAVPEDINANANKFRQIPKVR